MSERPPAQNGPLDHLTVPGTPGWETKTAARAGRVERRCQNHSDPPRALAYRVIFSAVQIYAALIREALKLSSRLLVALQSTIYSTYGDMDDSEEDAGLRISNHCRHFGCAKLGAARNEPGEEIAKS